MHWVSEEWNSERNSLASPSNCIFPIIQIKKKTANISECKGMSILLQMFLDPLHSIPAWMIDTLKNVHKENRTSHVWVIETLMHSIPLYRAPLPRYQTCGCPSSHTLYCSWYGPAMPKYARTAIIIGWWLWESDWTSVGDLWWGLLTPM